MDVVTTSEVMSLIADLTVFASEAEDMIGSAQAQYDRQRNQLGRRQDAELRSLEASYDRRRREVSDKATQAIGDAKAIMAEIDKMDANLSAVDKYYVRTKTKREEALASSTASRYSTGSDYFGILEQIKVDFATISKKYSEDILPSLLNGLNYFFSSQRKKDYEELLILRNTTRAFINEIEGTLPSLTEEGLADLLSEYKSQRNGLVERHNQESSRTDAQYNALLESVVDRVYASIDQILPDERVSGMARAAREYAAGLGVINTSPEVRDGVLAMMFVDYPVDLMVSSPIVASVIKGKCQPLLIGDVIRLPMCICSSDPTAWLVVGDASNPAPAQSLMHSVMWAFLSTVPAARLTFSVIDPENRGNSIAPFFDAKKKFPALFGSGIHVSQDDVAREIRRLNDKIDGILQYTLGNQYENVFEYARDHEDFHVEVELLTLYDFPQGLAEQALVGLRDIIRMGARCGVYVMMDYVPPATANMSPEYARILQAICDLATPIRQSGQGLSCNRLPMAYHPMPEPADFARFFDKYMLVCAGMRNCGVAFPSAVRKLIDMPGQQEVDRQIDILDSLMRSHVEGYGQVPPLGRKFPACVVGGKVSYPADIFAESVGYDRIVERFGSPAGAGRADRVDLPLLFDLRTPCNLFLSCPRPVRQPMQDLTHRIIRSFLSATPIAKTVMCVFDGEQRGSSIQPFFELRKEVPETFAQGLCTSREAMMEKLRSLNAQIDSFIQEKLGNQCSDIAEYNRRFPSQMEPVTLLVIYDFPSGLDAQGIGLLLDVLRNGSKCGVITIICHNPDIPLSRYDSIDEYLGQIQEHCTSIGYEHGQYRLLPYNLPIEVPAATEAMGMPDFVHEYAQRNAELQQQGISFSAIVPEQPASQDASADLRIPIGIGSGDRVVSLTMGRKSSHHGLIAGATGSGKSTLLHTLIMSSMMHYGPDQLHLYLMDFKSGTEFKVYETVRLPHIQLLALDAMQEFGESILDYLVEEMSERGKAMKEVKESSIAGYRRATGKTMPRILVIMDEFQILFNDTTNRKVALHCAELAKKIVTEGRAYGIHLLMATQSTKVLSELTLSQGTLEQMRIRIGLKCGESDARYLFSDRNDMSAMSLMRGPTGTAVMNLDYIEDENVGFRVAYADKQAQREVLAAIAKRYAGEPGSLRVFEGGRVTRLLDYFAAAGIRSTDEIPVRIHMGTLIKVAPPLTLVTDRKQRNNLLICGTDERMSNAVADNYIVSALLNTNASVYCVDGEMLVGDDAARRRYRVMEGHTSRFKVAESRGDIIEFVNEVFEQYMSRKRQGSSQTTFLVIKHLQFIDIVQSMLKGEHIDESEFVSHDAPAPAAEAQMGNPFAAVTSYFEERDSGSGLSVGEKLTKLIVDGSGYGINVVVTSLDYQTVRECMYYGDNVLARFPERIVFALGENDADMLIEGVSVTGLRSDTVCFTDGVRNTFQMKPYVTPSDDELQAFLASLG